MQPIIVGLRLLGHPEQILLIISEQLSDQMTRQASPCLIRQFQISSQRRNARSPTSLCRYMSSSQYIGNISVNISCTAQCVDGHSTTRTTRNGLLDFPDFSVCVGSSFMFMRKIKVEGRNFQSRFPKFAIPTYPYMSANDF